MAEMLYIAKVRKDMITSGPVAPKAMFYLPLIARFEIHFLAFFELIASPCDVFNSAMASCRRFPVAREAMQPLTTAKLAKARYFLEGTATSS